jgi:riboflavin kinase/FMN adenylyltransferase
MPWDAPMRLFRHYDRIPPPGRGAVVAIGNFDGVHRGHQAVIETARHTAEALGAPLGVMTFEPHPRLFFQPDQAPFRLTAFRTKARLLQALGVERLYCLPFRRKLASLEPEDFVRRVLVEGLGIRHLVVGDNFRFGRKRAGDTAMLETLGRAAGFGTTVLQPVGGSVAEAYSSTLVRSYLREGKSTRAALMLGRYWEIEGRVRHGAKRGRGFGFPTANLRLQPNLLRPAYGIYAVRVAIEPHAPDARRLAWLPGVANLGIAPMYGYDEPLLEVHLFQYSSDLYGRHLRVALVDYLRPERKFDNVEALKTQMAEDARRARETLAWETWDSPWPAGPFVQRGVPPGEGLEEPCPES